MRFRSQNGMAMVEIILVIVIISIAMVASLNAFSIMGQRSSDALIQARTLDIAQFYLDEVFTYPFDEDTEVGGVPAYSGGCRITDEGEPRSGFDDVDDLNVVDAERPSLVDDALAGFYDQYRVTIRVECDDSIGFNSGGGKRVDIMIEDPLGNVSQFSAYRGNY